MIGIEKVKRLLNYFLFCYVLTKTQTYNNRGSSYLKEKSRTVQLRRKSNECLSQNTQSILTTELANGEQMIKAVEDRNTCH